MAPGKELEDSLYGNPRSKDLPISTTPIRTCGKVPSVVRGRSSCVSSALVAEIDLGSLPGS